MLFLLNGRLIMIPIIFSWTELTSNSEQLLIIVCNDTFPWGLIIILDIAQQR